VTMAELDPDTVVARADLSRFLSACFYEPTPMFTEERMFESMREAAQRLSPELADRVRKLGEAFAEEDQQTLLVDYSRLFLGPVNPLAKPYGSFWLTGETTLMQEATMAVLDLYAQGGFEIDEDFRDLPDHVAVELEFLYVLTFRQNQARREGDEAAGAPLSVLRARFLSDHLGAWVGAFGDAMRQGAQTAFYRELAELTQLWIRLNQATSALH
jgi:putative dimethyl sulfoxide reductase chaperone